MEEEKLYWRVEALNDIDLGNGEMFEKGNYLHVPVSSRTNFLAPKIIVDTLRAEGFLVKDETMAMNRSNWDIKIADDNEESISDADLAMAEALAAEQKKNDAGIEYIWAVVAIIGYFLLRYLILPKIL